MIDKDLWNRVDKRKASVWVATWFGCGFMRKAPGTWGTLGGFPFGMAILEMGGTFALACAVVLVCVAGYFAAQAFDRNVGSHDSGAIVIDEVAGLWLTLWIGALFLDIGWITGLFAVAAFRVFDILKPWPINWLDARIQGAAGVMADDLMAALYAAGLLIIAVQYTGFV